MSQQKAALVCVHLENLGFAVNEKNPGEASKPPIRIVLLEDDSGLVLIGVDTPHWREVYEPGKLIDTVFSIKEIVENDFIYKTLYLILKPAMYKE